MPALGSPVLRVALPPHRPSPSAPCLQGRYFCCDVRHSCCSFGVRSNTASWVLHALMSGILLIAINVTMGLFGFGMFMTIMKYGFEVRLPAGALAG